MRALGPILVTGAAGKTGLAVTEALSRAGLDVRAAVRRPEQADRVRASGATEAVVTDLDSGRGIEAALDGAFGIYLIAPNVHHREREVVRDLIASATRAGVERITYHSVMHPYDPAMPHHMAKADAEVLVRSSTLRWCILQPAAYLQNYLPGLLAGTLRVPYSLDVPFTPVDLLDVAQVAALTFTEGGHDFATYELAGAERLSVRQLAAHSAHLLSRPVDAERVTTQLPPTLDDYGASALAKMFASYDRYGFVGGSHTLRHLLGRVPASLADVLARSLEKVGRRSAHLE